MMVGRSSTQVVPAVVRQYGRGFPPKDLYQRLSINILS